MNKSSTCLYLLILPLTFAYSWTAHAADEDLFPFIVSYDAPDNVTNISAWNHRPAGRYGHVRSVDGRLATDAGPIRFWATNLCFEACFPSKEQAQPLAARLARLGFNCVRMHHMDARSIWGDSPNKLIIDPQKLERLDYLIYQLKEHGIYTNLNLHVSRTLGPKEGFVAPEGRPKYDKGLDNFEPRMIEMQKRFARDLLTHVNPYTKTDYAHEPAVAFVEISNEDALFTGWHRGHFATLPEPYATTFRCQWNQWLSGKYSSTNQLSKAWNVGAEELGDEMLSGGDFSDSLEESWHMERDEQTDVQWTVDSQGPDGRGRLRIVVNRLGKVSWHPQLHQSGIAVRGGKTYTLSVTARSDTARALGVNCMMAHAPYRRLGLNSQINLSSQWNEYRLTFVADRDDENARVTFTSFKPGIYELTDVSLRPGGIVGLQPGQRLEDHSVPVLKRDEMRMTSAAREDFVDFLWDTERDHWWGMDRFLKDDLDVQTLVSGTQLSYSPVHIQAGLDYIDAHSYWNHPSFPGRPWDGRNWFIRNRALVNHAGGTLCSLAGRRVRGMAYTVSEYNHPTPNSYAAEGFPMIAAFGTFQRWDGIFSFTYSHGTDFEPRQIRSYFDIKGDPTRLVHMPACTAMFVRGDVSEASESVLVPLSAEVERTKLHETMDAWTLTADHLGSDSRVALLHALALDTDGQQLAPQQPGTDADRYESDTGELVWDASEHGASYFLVNTARSKVFTGFVSGRTFRLGDVTLRIGKTRLDWATVSMVLIDGQAFDGPGRILVAATGWMQNTGMQLQHLDDERITLSNQWGTEPILCEGVPAEITVPIGTNRVTLYALDESGNRREAIPIQIQGGKAQLALGPQHKTLWYEFVKE